MVWYLVTLVWLAVVGGIIYNYTRKQRARANERAQDMAKALVELRATANLRAVDETPVVPPAAAAPVPEFSRKPKLLPQPAALLYYVFRTGLPDHEIFAGVVLADVLDVAADAPAAQRTTLQRKLEQQRLDLVVCTKQLEVVAAVLIDGDQAASSESGQFAQRCLTAAGVRLVRVNPAAPPRHQQVHQLVYG